MGGTFGRTGRVWLVCIAVVAVCVSITYFRWKSASRVTTIAPPPYVYIPQDADDIQCYPRNANRHVSGMLSCSFVIQEMYPFIEYVTRARQHLESLGWRRLSHHLGLLGNSVFNRPHWEKVGLNSDDLWDEWWINNAG